MVAVAGSRLLAPSSVAASSSALLAFIDQVAPDHPFLCNIRPALLLHHPLASPSKDE